MGILSFFSRLFGGPSTAPLDAGAPAPGFSLRGVDDDSYSLQEALRQGPVLLAFFKKSCPTCRFTLPFLERLHRGLKDGNPTRLWGVSQDDAADTLKLAEELELTFPLLVDEPGYPVSNAYGLVSVPTLFLVKPAGTVDLSSVGFSRKDLEGMAARLAEKQQEPVTLFQPGERIPDYKPG